MPSLPVLDASIPPPRLKHAIDLTARRKPLYSLTGIRFLAALHVVLYHSRMPDVFAAHRLVPLANLLRNGPISVLLFFLLSGFILSYTYQGQIETRRDLWRFYEARFARIWPLYALSLPLTALFWHTTPRPLIAASVLLMVQSWNPWNGAMAGAWNFVCWTLSAEAFFYLIFPWLQRWLERRPTQVVLLLFTAMILLSITAGTGLVIYNADRLAWTHLPIAVERVPDFVVGVCLGNLFNRHRALASQGACTRLLPTPPAVWTTLAALASLILLCFRENSLTAVCVLTFAALLYGLAAENSPLEHLLRTRLLIVGGQISYGMYLLQWAAKGATNLLCDRLRIQSSDIRFGFYIILLLLGSVAGFFWFEEPARKFIRSVFSKLERRNPIELRNA